MACVIAGFATGHVARFHAAAVCGYGFASAGHFFVAYRPATFRHPIHRFIGDRAMDRDVLRRRIRLSSL